MNFGMQMEAARILDWYDGVQLFDGVDVSGRFYVSQLREIVKPREQEKWIAVETTREMRDNFRAGIVSLREVQLAARSWFVHDGWGSMSPGDKVKLEWQREPITKRPDCLESGDYRVSPFERSCVPGIYDELHAKWDAEHPQYATGGRVTPQELHTRAMDIAEDALVNRLYRRDGLHRRRLFREALRLELGAIEAMDKRVQPTWSVLCRSAGTMALDCRDYEQANELALMGLTDDCPGKIRAEIEELQAAIIKVRREEARRKRGYRHNGGHWHNVGYRRRASGGNSRLRGRL